MSNKIATGIGATIGFFSQDPSENFGDSVLGAAIGGAAGFAGSYDMKVSGTRYSSNINLKKTLGSVDPFAEAQERFNRHFTSFQDRERELRYRIFSYRDRIDSRMSKGKDATKLFYRMERDIQKREELIGRITHNARIILNDNNADPFTFGKISKRLGHRDIPTLNKMSDSLTMDKRLQTYSMGADSIKNSSYSNPTTGVIRSGDPNFINKVASHYSTHMGYDSQVAQSKALQIFNTFGSRDVSITGTTLKATSLGEAPISYPLTARDSSGINYTMVGNTKMVMKGMNPYGHIYANNLQYPDKYDIWKSYTTEDMLQFSNRDSKSLGILSDMMKRTMGYSGEDTLEMTSTNSALARARSNSIEYGITLKPKFKDGELIPGEFNLGRLNTVGVGEDTQSVATQLAKRLSSSSSHDIFHRISNNSVTQFMPAHGADNWVPALLPSQESGMSSTNIRNPRPLEAELLKSSFYNIMAVADAKGAQDIVDHSIQGYRLDVSSNVENALAKLYGSNMTLDDGYSIFRGGSMASEYTSSQSVKFKVSNFGTPDKPIYNTTINIDKILSEGEDLITPGTLGLDHEGKRIQLGKHFTDAVLSNVEKDAEGNLTITGIANHRKSDGDFMKVYSAASKSGGVIAPEDTFKKIAALSRMADSGRISIDDHGNVFSRSGTPISRENLLKSVSAEAESMFAGERNSKLFMISRAADTGQEDILNIQHGDKDALSSFAKKYSTNPLTQDMLNANTNLEKANLARTILSMSDSKAGADIFSTVGEHFAGDLNKISELIDIQRTLGDPNAPDRLGAARRYHGMLSQAFAAGRGITLTSATVEHGTAIYGAGKEGSMSWLENRLLKQSGISNKAIDSITEINKGAVLEADMIMSSVKEGSFNPSRDLDKSKFLKVFEEEAGNRSNYLKGMGINVDGYYLNYNLQNPGHGDLRSVGISMVDTGYSGTDTFNDHTVIKEMDKLKRDVIAADMSLSSAPQGTKAAHAERLHKSIDALEAATASLSKGVSKSLSTRRAINSEIAVISAVAGEANRVGSFDGKTSNAAFVSRREAERIAEKVGGSIDITTNGIATIFDSDGKQLIMQGSREPAQGQFSSIGYKMYMDRNIVGDAKNQVGLPKNSVAKIGAYGDFDGDAMKFIPVSGEARQELLRRTNNLMSWMNKNREFQESLGVKGSDTGGISILDFKSQSELNQFQASAGVKGRYRKPIAPSVTEMAMSMAEAIDSNTSLTPDQKVSATVMSHALTENMLKSKHKDTKTFLDKNGAVEKFLMSKDRWIEGSNTDYEFKTTLGNIIDETLGGKVNDNTRGTYNAAKQSLIDSYVSDRGRHIESNNVMPMMNKVDNLKDASNMVADIAFGHNTSTSGHVDPMQGSEQLARSGKRLYNDIKTNVVSQARKNWKSIGAGFVGLAALSAISRTPEVSAQSQPGTSNTLRPLTDHKAYTREYKNSKGYDVRADVQSARSNLNAKTINNTLFSDKSSTVNLNISDRSGL